MMAKPIDNHEKLTNHGFPAGARKGKPESTNSCSRTFLGINLIPGVTPYLVSKVVEDMRGSIPKFRLIASPCGHDAKRVQTGLR